MVAPVVMAAGIGALGSLAGGLLGSAGQHSANRANLELWREQRDWATQMSNTEIQRRVADLRAAGMNPMLSVRSMEGASTPNVGTPTMQNEQAELGEGVSRAAHSAADVAAVSGALQKQAAETRLTNAQAQLVEAQVPWGAANAEDQRKLLIAQVKQAQEQASKTAHEADQEKFILQTMQPLQKKLLDAQAQGVVLDNVERQAIADLYNNLKGFKAFEKWMPMFQGLLSLIRSK